MSAQDRDALVEALHEALWEDPNVWHALAFATRPLPPGTTRGVLREQQCVEAAIEFLGRTRGFRDAVGWGEEMRRQRDYELKVRSDLLDRYEFSLSEWARVEEWVEQWRPTGPIRRMAK